MRDMTPLLFGLAFVGVTLTRSFWLWRTAGVMLIGLAAGTTAIGAMLAARPRTSGVIQGLAAGLVLFALQVVVVHTGRWCETGVRPELTVAAGEFERWAFTASLAAVVVWAMYRPSSSVPFAAERY